jgi:amphi-Trp domain-containing protein
MSKESFKLKGLVSHTEVVTQLEELLQGFKTRELCLGDAKTRLTLTPSDALDLKIEGKIKKDKQKLSIEIAWRLPEGAPLEVSVAPADATPEALPEEDLPAPQHVQIAQTQEFSQAMAFPLLNDAEEPSDVVEEVKEGKSAKGKKK